MSIYGQLAPKGPSGFGYGSTAEEVTEGVSLAGKTMLVTGCNSGLGLETARVLALRGARVIGTARTADKAHAAIGPLGDQHLALACELSDPRSVSACVDEVKKQGIKLDAIIANAGIMALPKLEKAHGYELQFFTNHIGHFLLVTGLLDSLTEQGRVVMLSSDAHKRAPKEGIQFDNLDGSKGYSDWGNYGQSKLANLLFAKELSRRFAGSKRTANAVHPGVIQTGISRSANPVVQLALAVASPLVLKTIPQGAATQVWAAANPTVHVSGEYLSDCNVGKPNRLASDEAMARRLWEVSEKIVAELPKS